MNFAAANISTLDLSTLIPGSGSRGTDSEKQLAVQLNYACRMHGFFYLVNHGIPEDLMASTFAQAKHFFTTLTTSQKRTALAIKSRGYTPLAEETLDPEHQSRGDTKEGYYIGNKERADDADAVGCNIWPSESLCPGWKTTMQTYFAAVHGLGLRMLRILALSLNLDANYFDQHFSQPMEALRLLHYSSETSDVDSGVMGCGAHSDYGMLTFLLTDDVPGLEILERDVGEEFADNAGTWKRVAPMPNNFIVNLGDMLERWTNDTYRSTVHRVINRQGKERYSIPFFFEPNFDTRVECLPSFVTLERPAKYAPTTSGEYLLSKYANTHAMCGNITDTEGEKKESTERKEVEAVEEVEEVEEEEQTLQAPVKQERDTSWMNATNRENIVQLKEAEIEGQDRIQQLEVALKKAQQAMARNEQQMRDRKRAEQNAVDLFAKVEQLENAMKQDERK